MKTLLQYMPIQNGHFRWCLDSRYPQVFSFDCFRCKASGYLIAFLLGTAAAGLEFWGGFTTRSLSLLSDAWHMTFDVLGYAIGFIAMFRMLGARGDVARIAAERRRFEALMALTIAIAACVVLSEAWQRAVSGTPEIIESLRMFVVTMIGLVFNLVTFFLFKALVIEHKHEHEQGECAHKDHGSDMEDDILRANMLHTLQDSVSSVLVLILSVIFIFSSDPRFRYLDLFVTVIICSLLLKQALKMWVKRYQDV